MTVSCKYFILSPTCLNNTEDNVVTLKAMLRHVGGQRICLIELKDSCTFNIVEDDVNAIFATFILIIVNNDNPHAAVDNT